MAGHPPRGWPPATPAAGSPHRAYRPKGQRWAPEPARPRPQHVGSGPQQPAQWAGSQPGGAPDLRRSSQQWKAPPLGTPFRHPHSEQRRPARAHAVGTVLGPHIRTDRTWDTRVTEPRPPAPEDGRQGEGQRLTPDAPHNGGRPRLRIDALTGEWRNRDAGEGRGSELCEPGGLRHQAGGAPWRAPH